MTTSHDDPLIMPFPSVGPRMVTAYRHLVAALITGEVDGILIEDLPRPWDITTCTHPDLRLEVWTWLDQVVAWINSQYVWDPTDAIPPCWPQHPHLVHELGTLADQRRTTGISATSDLLETWHQHTLPEFTHRMNGRLHDACGTNHQEQPGTSARRDHWNESTVAQRQAGFT